MSATAQGRIPAWSPVPVVFGGLLGCLALAALAVPYLGLSLPSAIDATNILSGPSSSHWLGTDELGRDLLVRALYGARVSLSVAATAVVIAAGIGIPLGMLAALGGRRIGAVFTRIIDVLVAIPEIFVAILVLAFIQGGLPTLIGTIGFLYCPQFARVSYSMTRSIMARDHVTAARSLGAGHLWIVRHEILPNMASVIIVQSSFTLSFAMLMEAGLSFLGLGVRPPTPSWGQMVATLKDYIYMNPWPVLVPSIALLVTVLSVNVLGDWLQDRLNPELHR
jgi:peptide/nickel transport system permease protein